MTPVLRFLFFRYLVTQNMPHTSENIRKIWKNSSFIRLWIVRTPVNMKWSRVLLKRDGTRRRTGGEVKGKLANEVGSQYPLHYLGTWCIQHYYS